jgi:cell division protein FtsI (penicillin-binding protein 3)
MRALRRPDPIRRVWLVGGFVAAAALGLAWRLYDLQVLRQPELAGKAESQRLRLYEPDRPRLGIADRTGTPLAVDEPVHDLYVHPFLLNRRAEQLATRDLRKRKGDRAALIAEYRRTIRSGMATALAELLGKPAPALAALLDRPNTTVQLARGIPESARRRIEGLGLTGLEFNTRHRRVYPDKTNSAAVIGFVNYDGQGQFGVEQFYQKRLALSTPRLKLPAGLDAAPEPAVTPGELLADPGDHRLALTVDARLQRATRLALEKGAGKNRVSRGTAIVLDPHTGEILALSVTPTFDNNVYGASPTAHYKNWAVSDLYEPGSTFKPINIAVGLTAHAFRPETVVFDSGSASFGKYTIHNYDHRGRGALSVTRVLMYSDNIGMIRLMNFMKPGFYYDRLLELGLTRRSGVDLPGETRGLITTRTQFTRYPVQPATVSFGQGVALTPLQLARLHGAIANGGLLVTPHIVRHLEDEQGHPVWQPTLEQPRRVFSPEAAAAVREMMMHVVEEGTGKPARIPGYRVAGKTGTAQKANIGGRGYLVGKKITSFVAYLPARDPKYVILVVLDEPKSENAFGSTTAAPIVREICEELISYGRIPPSHPQELVPKKPAPKR